MYRLGRGGEPKKTAWGPKSKRPLRLITRSFVMCPDPSSDRCNACNNFDKVSMNIACDPNKLLVDSMLNVA
jgi:hypothetical protein